MQPFREVFWNIEHQLLFYSLAGLAGALFVYGFYRRWRFWRSGWPERREGGFDAGLVLRRLLLGSGIFRGDPLGGLMHAAILWGFVLLFLGTLLSTIDHRLEHFLRGEVYRVYAWTLDAAGLALLGGIALAYLRRYAIKRGRMETALLRDHAALLLLAFIAISGFLAEGLRLRAAPPPWPEPAPVGVWIAQVSGLSAPDAAGAHRLWWWLHALASLALVAYFPFSKFVHVVAAGANLALAGLRSSSFLPLAEREALRADFSRRHHLMFDACTQCDRCTSVCPSHLARESLAPRRLLDAAGDFARRKAGYGFWPRRPASAPAKSEAVPGEQVWLCTTCGHCQDECPSAISPLDVIRELRTARIESGEAVPENLQAMLESVYKFKNPWQGAKGRRLDWAAGIDLPVLGEGAAAERCFYVGCTFAYDTRLQQVPRAAVSLFRAAELPFGVLGKAEVCCGEFIRGVGEDGLFTELAGVNAAAFAEQGVREIVTACPHGFHAFRNEYRRLSPAPAERAVRHLAELLAEAIAAGRLPLAGGVERTVTFHDPCFLGRRSGVYEAPRAVLRAIPGLRLVEMPRSRENSFCCGGGGGRMWVEASEGERMAEQRLREAAATGAELVVTACPFCFSNLEDAVKTAGYEGRIAVQDLTELVAECLPGAAPAEKGA
ncbi:4Fe-4S dicluster domain-containing protein [bacterium]|nr:4Fe-4S dicluster domain-containing protein [bacterium]